MAPKNEDSSWEIIRIDSWLQFEKEIEKKLPRDWIYRGHTSVEWNLESSFYRSFINFQEIIRSAKKITRKPNRDEYEEHLIRHFKSNAHFFLQKTPVENDKLEWLTIMQHHGTSGRLLDWTCSPYIGAHFAVESGHNDCCVYALKHRVFTDIDSDHFDDANYKKKAFSDQRGRKSFFFPYEPNLNTERLVAQQGLFLVPSTNYETIDQILSHYDVGDGICIKYILTKSVRFEAIRRLRMMNISAATLFPGIDGFCRSLKYNILETSRRLQRMS